MKVYKYKHISSGLFYQPASGMWERKTNLGKGKIYTDNRNPLRVDAEISVSDKQVEKYNLSSYKPNWSRTTNNLKTKSSDWKKITYDLIEVEDNEN
jgi:hypothetical protein